MFCPLSFFFQAVDGIRDGHVTGVQTCALPILVYMANAAGADFDEPDVEGDAADDDQADAADEQDDAAAADEGDEATDKGDDAADEDQADAADEQDDAAGADESSEERRVGKRGRGG